MKRPIASIPAAVVLVAWSAYPAQAYLDPGAGSFLLQSLIGSIAAATTIGGLYFQRIKNFVTRLNGHRPTRKQRK